MNRTTREGLGLLAAIAISFLATVAITWPIVNYFNEVVLGGINAHVVLLIFNLVVTK